MRKYILILAVAGLLIFSALFAGCTTTPTNTTTPTVTSVPVTTSLPMNGTPNIMMVKPSEGATLTGNSVDVSVDVTNFSLVDALGKASVAGQGHIHYFIDVQPPTEPGKPAVTAPGSYAATINTTHTWENVSPGTHTFSVELANNDHTPLVPPVVRTVTVNVKAGGAKVAITAQNMKFDKSTITVLAGSQVTMTFTNNDQSIPHNFAVYTDAAATTTIFKGSVIAGPATTTDTFTAPSTPGTYFFRCDIHPTTMTGQFIVQ